MHIKHFILTVVLIVVASAGIAATPKPAFMQPEVLKAGLAMNLTAEQKPLFQQTITTFNNARMKAISNLLRKHNVTNLPRKSKVKQQFVKENG